MTASPVSIVTSRVRPEQVREASLVVIIVLLVAFFATQIDGYLSGTTFTRISASFAIVAVLAVGQTLVVLTRNVDLSVGSIVGLIAYGVGTLLGSFQDLPPVLVIGLCLVFGGVLGAINGVIVSWGRVPAIVTTLGTLAIFRVLLVELSGSKTVTTDSLPTWVVDLPRVDLVTIGTLDIRPLVVIALAVAVVFQLGLRYLPFGRRLFAIGSNPEGAQASSACRSSATCSWHSRCPARWPASPGSCSCRASGTSRSPPGSASSCRPLPPWSSAASTSSAASGRSAARCSAPS